MLNHYGTSGHSIAEMQDAKVKIHHRLMEEMNLKMLEEMEPEILRREIGTLIQDIIVKDELALNQTEREVLTEDVKNEVMGLGPIEPLLHDSSVSDILVNTSGNCYVERHGVLEKTNIIFQDNDHLMRIIQKIASAVGRRIDESSPMVDARLEDGSRVNAIIPPLSLDGPVLSIRRFSVDPYTIKDLLSFKSMTPPMGEFLSAAVHARINILITGGTGSGKTTLLNVVSSYIPHQERVLTIEDSAELQLQQPHVVRLETRPANLEGEGEIVQRDLVKNALRMRPDRIVVGEVRGGEALDMLQAMNTGHDGSLTTIHANSARDSLTRLEHMVGMSGIDIPPLVVRQQIAAALDLVVATTRLPDGHRVIQSIQEITGMEGDVVNMQELFTFDRHTVDEHGRVIGEFRATGIRPLMLKKFKERGIELDSRIFDPEKRYH
jgi:pilus assembly protein CpaF